jgi:hypothetical protein
MNLYQASIANEYRHPAWIRETAGLIFDLALARPSVWGDHVFAEAPIVIGTWWQREIDECPCNGRVMGNAWSRAEKFKIVEPMYGTPPDDAPPESFAPVTVASSRPEANSARLTVYRSLIYRVPREGG